MSDLHLEGNQYASYYSNFTFPVAAPALALLGDIGKATDEGLKTFLIAQCHRYDYVFYLLGNQQALPLFVARARPRFFGIPALNFVHSGAMCPMNIVHAPLAGLRKRSRAKYRLGRRRRGDP